MRTFAPQHTSFLRLNYYPRCPIASRRSSRRQSPHRRRCGHAAAAGRAAGAARFSIADVWWPVEPHPDALVVNLGDIAQVWSNDRYIAPLHRAIVHSSRGALQRAVLLQSGVQRRVRAAALDRRRAASATLSPDQLARVPRAARGRRLCQWPRVRRDQSVRRLGPPKLHHPVGIPGLAGVVAHCEDRSPVRRRRLMRRPKD